MAIDNGKPHWPDCMTIWMGRKRALQIISQLANGLEDDDRDAYSVSFCGELTESE